MAARRRIDERPAWARWLVEQREARGYRQRAFADLIRVSQQSLSNYERGITRPPEDVAEQIADALNLPYMTVRAQLGMFVPDDSVAPGDVIELPAGLTQAQRRALMAVIDAFIEQNLERAHVAPPVAKAG